MKEFVNKKTNTRLEAINSQLSGSIDGENRSKLDQEKEAIQRLLEWVESSK